MYIIGIVGDPHIDTHVSSRKDDYFQTCLTKIEEVASNCNSVIFLGDIFNRETIPNEYMYMLYNHMKYLNQKYDCTFYSIVGNHDIPNEDESNLLKTSLGLCDITGIIKLITVDKPLELGNFTFYTSYVNLEKCRNHLKTLKLGSNDILLLHQYFEDGFEGVELSDLQVGCDTIFLGHEHTPFPNFVKQYNDMRIYRCGSLLRNSANDSNLVRDVFYFKLDENKSVVPCRLESAKNAEEVFTEKAFTQENLHRKHFVQNISNVVEKYTNNLSTQEKFSIRQTLNELQTPENCLKYISETYTRVGETFL